MMTVITGKVSIMTRDEVIEALRAQGRIAKPCYSDNYIAVRCGEATNPNERMRLTASGQLLTVIDGYFWQIGTTDEVLFAMEKPND